MRWLSLPWTDNNPYERPMVIPHVDSRLWDRRPMVIPSADPWLWDIQRNIKLNFRCTPLVAVSKPASRPRLVLAGINWTAGGSEPSSTPKMREEKIGRGGERPFRPRDGTRHFNGLAITRPLPATPLPTFREKWEAVTTRSNRGKWPPAGPRDDGQSGSGQQCESCRVAQGYDPPSSAAYLADARFPPYPIPACHSAAE